MASFIFEAGMSTRVCFAAAALRIRVSISAIGSVIFIEQHPPSPARLRYAGQFTAQRSLAEANAAQAKLTHIGTRSPADLTAVVLLHLMFGLALRLHNH